MVTERVIQQRKKTRRLLSKKKKLINERSNLEKKDLPKEISRYWKVFRPLIPLATLMTRRPLLFSFFPGDNLLKCVRVISGRMKDKWCCCVLLFSVERRLLSRHVSLTSSPGDDMTWRGNHDVVDWQVDELRHVSSVSYLHEERRFCKAGKLCSSTWDGW